MFIPCVSDCVLCSQNTWAITSCMMIGISLRCLCEETPIKQRKDWVFPAINTARKTCRNTQHLCSGIFGTTTQSEIQGINTWYHLQAIKHGTNDHCMENPISWLKILNSITIYFFNMLPWNIEIIFSIYLWYLRNFQYFFNKQEYQNNIKNNILIFQLRCWKK